MSPVPGLVAAGINLKGVYSGCFQSAGYLKSFVDLSASVYVMFKPISIDYGLMEPITKNKTQRIFCIKGSFDWVDIGSWSSIEDIYDKDDKGNIVLSNTGLIDVKGSIIIGERNHKIGVIGLRDLIIVQTKSGTLVCNKHRAQEVKELKVR